MVLSMPAAPISMFQFEPIIIIKTASKNEISYNICAFLWQFSFSLVYMDMNKLLYYEIDIYGTYIKI